MVRMHLVLEYEHLVFQCFRLNLRFLRLSLRLCSLTFLFLYLSSRLFYLEFSYAHVILKLPQRNLLKSCLLNLGEVHFLNINFSIEKVLLLFNLILTLFCRIESLSPDIFSNYVQLVLDTLHLPCYFRLLFLQNDIQLYLTHF